MDSDSQPHDSFENGPDAAAPRVRRASSRAQLVEQACEALARARESLTEAADALERAGALDRVVEVARTQAFLADALTCVTRAPADERIELLLAMVSAARGDGPAGRH